jgi:hypothetical protein
MIPRYQRILFWILIGGIALMAAFLLHGCQQAHKRLTAFNDPTPIAAPITASTEDVTLYLASDADGSITATSSQVALPKDASIRARILLDHLIAQYALPTSAHPLQPGPAVDDVFLLNNQAIINLRSSFVDNHPSGVLVEDLTIQSIIGTLHASLPQITEIRFLVDGESHDTLAGHADLQRTYPAADTTTKPTPPSEEATQ